MANNENAGKKGAGARGAAVQGSSTKGTVVPAKHRRLKRSVRRTLGAILLISALVVAAIPVDNLQASTVNQARGTGKKVTLYLYSDKDSTHTTRSNIPDVSSTEQIYTTGDGRFQFAYVYPAGATGGPKIAVILGYQKGGNLDGGVLEIPNTVDAFMKYSNVSTNSGYAAVNKEGEFLYYQDYEYVTDIYGNPVYELDTDGNIQLDAEGNPVRKRRIVYLPCYYEDRGKWENLKPEEFYYRTGTSTVSAGEYTYALTTSDSKQRIHNAAVWYIGNQYLTADTTGNWKVAGDITSGANGIFAGAANISTLKVGEDLSGIGNYAFYGCAGMNSITLNNGLDTIGNYAFANCVNMLTANIDVGANLSIIGDHAFYNCQALENFVMPRAVTKLGDSAFEDCFSMTSIDMTGNGNSLLKQLGYDVFKGCANLQSITFPRTFSNMTDNGVSEALDVTIFRGCSSLKYIEIGTPNNSFDIAAGEDSSYGMEEFKADMPATFYLKGQQNTPLHETATANEIAFSYYDSSLERQVYELTVTDSTTGKKAVYRVDDNDELVYCEMETGMETVELPTTIGPNSIRIIDEYTFQNKCSLKKITIPASITAISQNAFKGCHNLEDVIFTDPTGLRSIGSGAFRTQEVTFHEDTCDAVTQSGWTLPMNPTLNFVGPISYTSTPFLYAMDPNEKINVGSQYASYITYYSGWPTNLVVQYDPDTDRNALIDYPTFNDISTGLKYIEKTTDGRGYAYMTADYEAAAKTAVDKYFGRNSEPMTDYEKAIIDAALNVTLPAGIEAIKMVEETDSQGNTVKVGLFSYNENHNELITDDSIRKTVTANSLIDLEANTFKDCEYIRGIYINGDTRSVGDYAFQGCTSLTDVKLAPSVSTMGLRPFAGCELLSDVNFGGGPYFVCDNSIIFELDDNGNKNKIVEYLLNRSSTNVRAEDIAGVTAVYPEAFMETGVGTVDFSETTISTVPENAFRSTGRLYSVQLPSTCLTIGENAFTDSALQQITIPSSVAVIRNTAFDGTDKRSLEFVCEEGSVAQLYATENGIKWVQWVPEVYYTVTFYDKDGNQLGETQKVLAGSSAEAPEPPVVEGYVFKAWVGGDYTTVTENLKLYAQYETEDPETRRVTVTFADDDGTVIETQRVEIGSSAKAPADPVKEGYRFIGWLGSFENVTADVTIYAKYERIDSTETQHTVRFIDWNDEVIYTQRVTDGEDAIIPQSPTREGYTFTGWRPLPTNVTKDLDTYAQYEKNSDSNNGGDSTATATPTPGGMTPTPTPGTGTTTPTPSPTPTPTPGNGSDDSTSSTLYTLTVQNGSGSGSYVAGSQPIIIANDPSSNQEFAYWTIDPENTKIASKVLSATVVTMPEGNVTVTAHYRAKSNSGSNTGTGNNGNNNNNNNNYPSNGGNVSNGKTTVIIDKNGLSNTGVVSATVNGSSDNFTIMISENASATESVLRALLAEYGNIESIKYFPMDISLYDSTGTKKITDTTGLSISITLPLPDSLKVYAGNNKVAGVVNDRLDKLSAKFTTINNVPCVTFTAEHFSPYVIYVNTANIGTGSNADNTPKTGDGIHPKWFLSIGLACLSFVMFMQKDTKKKQKAAVRAAR